MNNKLEVEKNQVHDCTYPAKTARTAAIAHGLTFIFIGLFSGIYPFIYGHTSFQLTYIPHLALPLIAFSLISSLRRCPDCRSRRLNNLLPPAQKGRYSSARKRRHIFRLVLPVALTTGAILGILLAITPLTNMAIKSPAPDLMAALRGFFLSISFLCISGGLWSIQFSSTKQFADRINNANLISNGPDKRLFATLNDERLGQLVDMALELGQMDVAEEISSILISRAEQNSPESIEAENKSTTE